MTPWIVVTVAAVGVLALALATLFVGARVRRRRAARPEWDVPSPESMRQVRFPVVWQGYDPETVDVTLDALFESYEELYFAAGPEAIRAARENLAVRRGALRTSRLPAEPASVPGVDADVETELDRSVLHESAGQD